ncbi:MAG: hypothetical protein OXI22_00870 [Defluviicoccus sp.]|nr:hypothetical protein [Defluviicoccus sp.]MDE0382410.1 hypothetical protein [Defluviicoccus sp.]
MGLFALMASAAFRTNERGQTLFYTSDFYFWNRRAYPVPSEEEAERTKRKLRVATAAADAPLMRLRVEPSPENGLRAPSLVTVDKAMSIRTEKLGPPFGRLAAADRASVNRAPALFLGIAG